MSKIAKSKRKVQQPHWYRIYEGQCPVCWRNAGYRERVYGPKPKRRQDCYVLLPDQWTYCGCLDRG